MKKTVFRRLAILGCCAAFITFAAVTHSFGQSSPIFTFKPLRVNADQSVIPSSGTMLARTDDGIFMNINTIGLVPGTVATAWIAVYNTPAACATNPCRVADLANPDVHGTTLYGGGKVVGADGTATFGGFRSVTDTTGVFGGTVNRVILPLTAEIHLVVRTHGVASTDPAMLTQQLTTFNGGCPPNTCTSIQSSVNQQ